MIDVLLVQQLLNQTGESLVEDGSVGPATTNAVKQFQLQNNLLPDGKISAELIAALKSFLAVDNVSSVSIFEKAKSFLSENKKPIIILGSISIFGYGVWFLKTNLAKKSK